MQTIITLFMLGFSGLYIGLSSRSWRLHRYLRRHGVTTSATVVSIDRHNNGDYDVDRLSLLLKTPESKTLVLKQVAEVSTGTYVIGEQVVIQYDPRAPQRCLPSAQLHCPGADREPIVDILIVPLFFGLFIVLILFLNWADQRWGLPKLIVTGSGVLLFGVLWLCWYLSEWARRSRTSKHWNH